MEKMFPLPETGSVGDEKKKKPEKRFTCSPNFPF